MPIIIAGKLLEALARQHAGLPAAGKDPHSIAVHSPVQALPAASHAGAGARRPRAQAAADGLGHATFLAWRLPI